MIAFSNGVWLFANRAHGALYGVLSRLGITTVYHSVLSGLKGLSASSRSSLKLSLRAGERRVRIVLDNTQAYHRKREARIGQESHMQVGTAATAIVLDQYDPESLKICNWDVNAGQKVLKDMNIADLEAALDVKHMAHIFSLHWLLTLTDHIPALSQHRNWVLQQFRSKAAKTPMAEGRRTEIHPLGTSDANEATTTGLKDALTDFVSDQLGLGPEELEDQLVIVTGDGMTFNGMLRLKRQAESGSSDSYRGFRWLLPMLEVWHTIWTDLSRIARLHWGPSSTVDCSSIWHNATAANHPTPSNFKKVDFYPTQRTVDMVLSTRMLDCWR